MLEKPRIAQAIRYTLAQIKRWYERALSSVLASHPYPLPESIPSLSPEEIIKVTVDTLRSSEGAMLPSQTQHIPHESVLYKEFQYLLEKNSALSSFTELHSNLENAVCKYKGEMTAALAKVEALVREREDELRNIIRELQLAAKLGGEQHFPLSNQVKKLFEELRSTESYDAAAQSVFKFFAKCFFIEIRLSEAEKFPIFKEIEQNREIIECLQELPKLKDEIRRYLKQLIALLDQVIEREKEEYKLTATECSPILHDDYISF